ncbi:MAG TPA: TetR/AcrR family transcriptional regulator [Kineosporiaceae bacterium]
MLSIRRPTRQELDQAIIDSAAALFARHGYAHTSVQQIADAVGYSKTGLLHRFPSKEALRGAVVEEFVAELQAVVAAVEDRPVGPTRDLAVVRAFADLALRRQGSTALIVSALTAHETPGDLAWLKAVAHEVFRAFGMDGPDGGADLDRRIRVYGALGAVSVIALATTDMPREDVHDRIVATAFDALGHPPSTAG